MLRFFCDLYRAEQRVTSFLRHLTSDLIVWIENLGYSSIDYLIIFRAIHVDLVIMITYLVTIVKLRRFTQSLFVSFIAVKDNWAIIFYVMKCGRVTVLLCSHLDTTPTVLVDIENFNFGIIRGVYGLLELHFSLSATA